MRRAASFFRGRASAALAVAALAVVTRGVGGPPGSRRAAGSPLLREFVEPAPRDPEVHASTLVEAADGTFVAAWFAGSKEGEPDVTIWSARRTTSGWSAAHEVARGFSASGAPEATYNPVLFHAATRRLALVYSVGRPGIPWTPWLQESDDDGRTWSAAVRLPRGIRGPDRNRPIRVDRQTLLYPSTGGTAPRSVHVEVSNLQLRDWRRGPAVADPHRYGAIQPTLLDHGSGRIQMLCRSYARELVTSWSSDGGRTWTPLESLGIHMANSAIDAARLPDGRFVLVYNPSARPADSQDWGQRVPLSVAVSTDGRVWRRVLDLETQRIREGYAYPCVLVGSDGLVHLTYTWGRKRIRYVVLDPARL